VKVERRNYERTHIIYASQMCGEGDSFKSVWSSSKHQIMLTKTELKFFSIWMQPAGWNAK